MADRTSSHLLAGHDEAFFIQLSVEDATKLPLEIIGSKQSYALKWCKPNNDDDDAFLSSPEAAMVSLGND